jgi:hypothetical protein
MARYYFHIRDGLRIIPDDEGMDLPNIAAARFEAQASADDLAFAAIQSATSSSASAVEITDACGNCLEWFEVRVRRLA